MKRLRYINLGYSLCAVCAVITPSYIVPVYADALSPAVEQKMQPGKLEYAIEQGKAVDADATFRLARRYEDGDGVPRDHKLAAQWMLKAANHGYIEAMNSIGEYYIKGLGIERNPVAAASWFRKSAIRGDAAGQYYLGDLYYIGLGVGQNFKEAKKWFELSAGQGNANGQFFLGQMYVRGQVGYTSFVEAEKWFKLAAQQRLFPAQLWLADILFQKYPKTAIMSGNSEKAKQELAESCMWYYAARENTVEGSAQWRVVDKRWWRCNKKMKLEKMDIETIRQQAVKYIRVRKR